MDQKGFEEYGLGGNPYERYGLTANPFKEVTVDSVADVDIYHVPQDIDDELVFVKEAIVKEENSEVILLTGDEGIGKTQRLLLLVNEARQNNLFHLFMQIHSDMHQVFSQLLDDALEDTGLTFTQRTFTPPTWYQVLSKARKKIKKGYDAELVGDAVATALNENTPSFLLLDDLHLLPQQRTTDFFHTLRVILERIRPGVLVMLTGEADALASMMQQPPEVDGHVDRGLSIPPLTNNEAQLLIAKRLLGKRLVEGIDPLYPFTGEAVQRLNESTQRNPKVLIRAANKTLEFAAKNREIKADENTVENFLERVERHQLPLEAFIHRQPRTGRETKQQQQPSQQSLDDAAQPGTSPDSQPPSPSVSPADDTGPPETSVQIPDGDDGAEEASGMDACEQSPPEGDVQQREEESATVKVKCPECGDTFTFKLSPDTTVMTCPGCGFRGKVPGRG